jgi:hypothetical protein
MNSDRLQQKLIAAARTNPPDDHVPYAFEQRVMARLATVSRPDEWVLWTRALWYGAGVSVAVAVFISAWSLVPGGEQDVAANFSQDLEQTILGSPDDGDNAW